MAKTEAGYKVTTPLIETDARGAFGMLQRLRYDDILEKKQVRQEIRKALTGARKQVMTAVKSAVPNDPRKSYLGVKMVIYKKKAVGGNISLYNGRSTGKKSVYTRPKGGVSGIKRKRPKHRRTKEVEEYYGRDRAFILRFLNKGTVQRTAFTKYATSKNNVTANRGSISGRNFFASADQAVGQAANTLSKRIEMLIVKAGYKVT